MSVPATAARPREDRADRREMPRILVADDNPAIHEDVRRVLQSFVRRPAPIDELEAALFGSTAADDPVEQPPGDGEFEIDAALHGAEAVDRVRQARAAGRPYGLVFMDVRMPPGIDGIQATTEIWRNDPEVQVVLCSAYSDYSWTDMIATLGRRDNLLILRKPFDPTEVIQAAHALTRKWALARRVRRRLDDLERGVRARTRALESANARLRELVEHDHLTGLLNRRGLERALAAEQARQQRGGAPLIVLLVDCDHFKAINDRAGYAVGDEVLREVATRLQSAVRPTDHVGRLGGDEFLVLLPQTGVWDAMGLAERLRLGIGAGAIAEVPDELIVTVSVGVAAVTPRASLEETSARAQLGLRVSKGHGRNRVSREGGSRTGAGNAGTLEAVRSLADAGIYRVVAQPIIRLEDARPTGVELLARTLLDGFTEPEHFFRLAMDNRVLTLVDLHCLEACAARAGSFPEELEIHVNLFGSTLINASADRILAPLERLRPAHRLCVELSEQQFFADSGTLRERLADLRSQGVRIGLDDVGFGRTSLELLVLMTPDVVKIDRRFVTGCGRDRARATALARLIRVVDAIGAAAIAEGIETPDDLAAVRALGVEHGQGFHWGRPLECVPDPPDPGARSGSQEVS